MALGTLLSYPPSLVNCKALVSHVAILAHLQFSEKSCGGFRGYLVQLLGVRLQ